MKTLLYFPLLFLMIACNPSNADTATGASSSRILDFNTFGDYWYQGKAELNAYDLEQYRYGEKRHAEAVLIFVTEDLSKEKQVKLDDPQQNKVDAQMVLKLNLTKKFLTGIYPYSMMLSVFTPVYDNEPAVKVTASVQEWCGHTFTQLNRRDGKYQAQLFSYFEKESDQQITIDAIPEDNLWTLIRLGPDQVPIGKLKLIPALLDQRFTHEQLDAEDAEVSMEAATAGMAGFSAEALRVITVTYTNYPRILRIFFTASFPYEIAGWEEVRTQEGKEHELSRATRKASMLNDYWTQNKNASEPLRQEMKMERN